jgi:ribosome-binding protein aMBF1 (putative translation factor)
MLPTRKSADFPKALKKIREDKGLSYSDLARMVNIHTVMPSRYENTESKLFVSPSQDTWNKLNDALFPDIKSNHSLTDVSQKLSKLTVEQLIAELKNRGAKDISMNW